MSKPPEEGLIWEWRAFGTLPQELSDRCNCLPIRAGLDAAPDLDIYLISRTSNQNIKLRRSGVQWVLKLKPLLETMPGGIDLYRESPNLVYGLPTSLERLKEAARLLRIKLPARAEESEKIDRDELLDLFRSASPSARVIEVPKVRWQFVIDRGWIELADVNFPNCHIQTISIHSQELPVVEAARAEFDAAHGLEVMNYVEACRRWG